MEWTISSKEITGKVSFESQTDAALFLLEVAKIADDINHHPDIQIVHCSDVFLTIYSHDTGTVEKKDHKLKDKISMLIH